MNNLFKTFVFLLFIFSSLLIKAQDLIVTNEGNTFKVFRIDVGKDAVYYQLEDNEESPILKIKKTDVLIIKLQDGTIVNFRDTGQNITTNSNSEDEISFPQEPVVDSSVIASLEIGSLIEFYDGSKGIVFYLDGKGHGLAVSLQQKKCLWQNTSTFHGCVDIRSLPNNNNISLQMGLGMKYCNIAIDELGIDNLPAIKWCRSIGQEWYLPSLGELYELIIVANQSQGRIGPISTASKANGGDSFKATDGFYFSSSEEDDTDVFAIAPKGWIKGVNKYEPNYCRAIRMF